MPYALPQDNYDTYLAAPANSGNSTLTVNVAPTKTAGVLTIYETDGRTIREKVYYTGVSGTTLTGVVRGIRFVDVGGIILFTSDATLVMDHPSGARIAMTDNIHYLGLALAVLNGDMEMGGVMQLPASRTINSSRDVIDKEYADALSAGTMSQLLVSKNGADPTLTVNVNNGRFGLRDQTSALYAGAAAQAVTANQTNYIELIATGSGTLAINTSGFTTGRIPLAIAVTNGTGITSLTDARQFFIMHDGLVDQVRTWLTNQTFSASVFVNTPTIAGEAAPKSYADLVSATNEATGTSGEAIAAFDWVYVKASDGKLYKTDADADESTYSVVGMALAAVGAADLTVRYAKPGGFVTGLSGLTAGSYYFLSGTAGGIAVSAHATRVAKVAQAHSTTSIRIIEPKFRRTGTATITATGNTVITTGFYPAIVRVRAGFTQGSRVSTCSVGDDQNCCVLSAPSTSVTASYKSDRAWYVLNDLGTVNGAGTIDTKTQTGFTLNCATFNSVDTIVQWEAESL
jgi:hypothetical protein